MAAAKRKSKTDAQQNDPVLALVARAKSKRSGEEIFTDAEERDLRRAMVAPDSEFTSLEDFERELQLDTSK